MPDVPAILRPTVVRVDLAALRHNFRLVRRRLEGSGTSVMATLKGDAFGHGLVEIARVLAEEGVERVAVGGIEDGLRLRAAGFALPVVVLGGFLDGSEPEGIAAGLTPVVFRSASARALNALASRTDRSIGIHLAVDTGMGRLGVPRGLLGRFLDLLEGLEHVYVEGLMTELADAAGSTDDYTIWQIEGLHAALDELAERGHRPLWVHAADSAAVMLRRIPDPTGVFSLVRPGRVLFGLAPSAALEGAWPLRPVLSWETAISFLKRVPAGARLSEGGAWAATRATRVASLPVGYGDGYPARLGGRAGVLVRGHRAPVIGHVGVDLTLADVTDVPGVQEGDRVTLLGRQDDQEVSAGELAALLEQPPDAILTGISRSRVPRVYTEGPAPALAAGPPPGG